VGEGRERERERGRRGSSEERTRKEQSEVGEVGEVRRERTHMEGWIPRWEERDVCVCVCVRDYVFWDWIVIQRLAANLISHRPNEEPIGCQGALR